MGHVLITRGEVTIGNKNEKSILFERINRVLLKRRKFEVEPDGSNR